MLDPPLTIVSLRSLIVCPKIYEQMLRHIFLQESGTELLGVFPYSSFNHSKNCQFDMHALYSAVVPFGFPLI